MSAMPNATSPSLQGRRLHAATLLVAVTALGAIAGLNLIDDPRPLDVQLSTAMQRAGNTMGDWQDQLSRGLQVSLRAVADGRDKLVRPWRWPNPSRPPLTASSPSAPAPQRPSPSPCADRKVRPAPVTGPRPGPAIRPAAEGGAAGNPAPRPHPTAPTPAARRRLHALCDRRQAQRLGNVDEAAHRHLVQPVGHQGAHELAVDLEHIHRQRLQVRERRRAGAEIVQRDAHAQALHLRDEGRCLTELGDDAVSVISMHSADARVTPSAVSSKRASW